MGTVGSAVVFAAALGVFYVLFAVFISFMLASALLKRAIVAVLAAARASLATALPGATSDASAPVVPAATRSMALTA